jgi:hypothetical protein
MPMVPTSSGWPVRAAQLSASAVNTNCATSLYDLRQPVIPAVCHGSST